MGRFLELCDYFVNNLWIKFKSLTPLKRKEGFREVCDCVSVSYNHWHVADTFPSQSRAEGETFSLSLSVFALQIR